jgi:uncharacterized protein YkwD
MVLSPRMPIVLVLAAALLASVGSLATPATARAAWATGGYSTADEDLMLQLINNARVAAGLKPVVMDSRVRSVAESRSSDFVQDRYFGHNIPTSCDQVFSLLQQQAIGYSWAAENIGWNTMADDTSTKWQFDWFMSSSTHKANILSPLVTSIGVGAYKDTWTFGTACGQTGTGATYTGAHLFTIVFIQADATAPTVTAPASRLYASTGGTTTIPVRTSWTRTDASGIASSTLERQVNGGSFGTVVASASTVSVDQSLADGSTYRYRARATDLEGNTCGYVYGPTFKPSRVDQASTAVTYGGSWATASSSYASGGSFRYTSTAGASASFTTTAASLAWMAVKSTSGGSADVYVDGVLKTTISLYASSTAWRPIVYTLNYSSQTTHTIKIVAKGNGRIYLDAFLKLVRV